MALIRLSIEIPDGAPERQLGDIREFCRSVAAIARSHGHEVVMASAESGPRRVEDLVVAVPIGYSSVTERELDAARDSDTPVVVLLPDHLSVPAAVRENPVVVEIRKWRWLGAAIGQFKRFLGEYQSPVSVH